MDSPYLQKPVIDDLDKLDDELRVRLQEVVKPIIGKSRSSKEQMTNIILELCTDHYIEIAQLAKLLDRTRQSIRQNYLKAMVNDKTLSLAFPQAPKTPRQAYTREDS